MTLIEAQNKLERGEINGFSIGERVYAKRDTWLCPDGPTWGELRLLPKGTHLIAVQFSKTAYGFELDGQSYTSHKRNFGTFPKGKVVLKTWS